MGLEPPWSVSYLLVSGQPDRVATDDHCLVLPDATAMPALVVLTSSLSPAGKLLASLPNARHEGDIPVPGSAPYVSCAVTGALPLLSDETAVAPTVFERSGGIGMWLDGLTTSPATSRLRLRWTVLAPGSSQPAPNSLRFGTRLLATSRDLGPSAGYHDCQPTAWHAGDTVFTEQGPESPLASARGCMAFSPFRFRSLVREGWGGHCAPCQLNDVSQRSTAGRSRGEKHQRALDEVPCA
jgi:hypothetical protein